MSIFGTEEESKAEQESMYWEVMIERYCHDCAGWNSLEGECEDYPGEDDLPDDFPSCYVPLQTSSESEPK